MHSKALYDSYPYPLAQPENLYVIGTLMGLSPAALEHANVLEIGCASGGNLFAHALHYPESRITGFDLHPGEIEAARAHSERLGVTSITWRTGDAADAAMYEGGPYDYIICHGLYSWIPEASAADMMAHIQASLSPNGIAYVSYNTMPGWAVPETVAHMMRYHVEAFPKEERAIEQAFSLLSFVRDGVGAKQSPYAKMLESEWNLMTERPLSYMEQEYFSDHRRALYFHEFMEKAEREGFEYLADSYLPSMYVGRMPQEVQPLLIQMGANIIRTEQYMDFMTNRRFRTSLLVKKGQKIERSIAPQLVNRFHVALSFGLSSSMGMDAQMKLDAPISIMKESQIYYESHDPLVRLFLHLLLQKAPTAFAMECLIDEAAEVIDRADNRAGQAMICEGYEGEKNRQVLSERLCHIALELLLFGVIALHVDDKNMALLPDISPDSKPCIWPLARYQASFSEWVTNLHAEKIAIGKVEQYLLPLLDSTRNKEAIKQELLSLWPVIEQKDKASEESHSLEQLPSAKELMNEFDAFFEQTMTHCHKNGLLVAQ